MTLPAAQQRVAKPGTIDSVSIVADEGVGQRELADLERARSRHGRTDRRPADRPVPPDP
jgi:hypothetical protein